MYISSPAIAASSRQGVMQAQGDLATVQQELASLKLADAGLSLGGRSGQLVDVSTAQSRLQALTGTNTLAATRLGATTSALDTIRTAATGFLSALTAAASGATSTIGATAGSSLAALTATLNTNVAGQSIFAGINTGSAPLNTYVQSPASASKQAVDAAFSAAFDTSQTSSGAASISGADLQSFLDTGFASLFTTAGYASTWSSASDDTMTNQISPTQTASTSVSANQEPFRQLAQAYTMVSEFGSGSLSTGATKTVIAAATSLVSQALAGLTTIETGVGATQSAITSASTDMATQLSLLSTQADSLDGVDGNVLATRLAALQTQIQASYEMTAKLQSMSLVSYLS